MLASILHYKIYSATIYYSSVEESVMFFVLMHVNLITFTNNFEGLSAPSQLCDKCL